MALPSSTIVITAEQRAAADARLPTNTKATRKRCMAGHQVERIAEPGRTLLPHQQQPKHRTAPPIKLRRVTDDQPSCVTSLAEQTPHEVIAVEPAEALRSNSRPVAAVRPRPQPSSINQVNVIIDNAQMEPGVSAMATSSRQHPVIQPATVSYRETMEHFDPEHYDQLVDKFDNQEYSLEILEAATQVLETCQNRAITVKATLFGMLKFHDVSRHHSDLKKFFEKCNVFFAALNHNVARDTACLSSMLSKSCNANIGRISNSFVNIEDTEIRYIAKSPWLKNISSMCHGKGLPKEADVKAFLKLPCLKEGWQGNDEAVQDKPLDRALVTNISSMCNGKGLPKEVDVKAFLRLSCLKEGWQGNDEAVQDKSLDRALVANISSICNGKGLPKEADVQAFLKLPCLKEGWQGNDGAVQDNPLDRTLVTHISSMCSSKGLPKKADVKAFLKLPSLKEGWQGNDEAVKDKPLDRALVTHISSMCNGKGLPSEVDLKAFLMLPCLKEGWQGNDEAVKDKPLDRALVSNISSMCHSKGLPKEEDMKAFLKLPCLKEGWQDNNEAVKDKPLDRALVSNISSMCSGKGLPKEAEVKAFLKLPCLKEAWKGNDKAVKDKPVDRVLFANISTMCNRKGLPKEASVAAFVQWLPADEKKKILKLACRIFVGFGLPKQETLAKHEKILCHYFEEKLANGDGSSITANSGEYLLIPESREHNGWSSCLTCTGSGYSTDNGYDFSDTDNDDLPAAFQIKALTLFCVAPAKWRLTIAEFDQYLAAHKRARNERTAVLSALELLLQILANHGGPGLRLWLEKHHENRHSSEKLTKALSIPAPLEQTKFALTQLPESQWQEYLELCRNLKPAPDKAQWDSLKPLRQQLDQRFKLTLCKRMMLEILWPQSQESRSSYAGQMDSLFKTVPTISQLHRIHQAYQAQKMKDFLDACLAWQGTRETVPNLRIQERLLEGLLLANHHLDGQGEIPDLCFSKRVSSDNGKGVIVDGDRAMAGQERLWHFIDAMLIELEQTKHEFKKQRLTVLPPDCEPVVLPKPEFALTGTGFVIKNWSPGQLTAFFKATGFTEQWYEKPNDKRQLCTIRLKEKRKEKVVSMKARGKEAAQTGDKKTTPLLLEPSRILNLINSKLPLKPAVWKSIEHYARNGQLTARLCKALAPVIDNEPEGMVPDVVKNTVTAILPQIQGVKASEVRTNTLTSAQPPMSVGIHGAQANFESAMKALDRFQVLEKAELEMLESHRNRMTFIQLMSVITKISESVDAETQIQWYIDYEYRRKIPLGLNEIWARNWLSASESRSQDWIEELLR